VVDEKDFQILAHLARDPFASNEKIGRALGLSGNSIKRRIEALVAEGVVPSTWLLPVPQIFRRHSRIFVYEDFAKPDESIDLALKTDPVVWAGFDVDRSFHIHTYTLTPDAAAPDDLVNVIGEPAFAVSPPFSELTQNEAVLSSLDLRILLVLIRRPRASLKEVAAATGLSAKTVRRHRDAMFANGLFILFPVIHVARARGLVLYNAYAQGAKVPPDAQRILSALPRCRLITTRTNPPGVWMICWADSMAEVADMEARLRALPGVERAGIIMRQRVDFAVDRLEGWIREEIAKWSRRPSTDGPGRVPPAP
jgi:DNA-binding Lrp family transcriptional regulator